MEEIFNKSTLDLTTDIYTWYAIVPVLVGILLKKRFTKTQNLIFYIVILSALNHYVSMTIREYGYVNVWLYHLYVPVLFYLTWLIYSQELKNLYSKRVFYVILGVSLLFFVVNSVFLQSIMATPTNAIFALSGVFILFGFSYFYSLLQQTEYKSLEREPLFWFTTGVLLYYSSTIVVFLLVFNILVGQTEASYIALTFNAIFNLVLVTAYIISLWVKPPL